MRNEVSEKILDERFAALPERLKEVLLSDHMQTVIEEIGSKQELDGDTLAELDNAVTYVILGLTPPRDFIRTVSENLRVDFGKASAIANEVNERVFRPVRDELKALHNIGDSVQATGYNSRQGSTLTSASMSRLNLDMPDIPRKSIDAELTENVGLKPPAPPVPMAPKPKPLDAELSESMRKPPVPPPPATPRPRPSPSFTPPPRPGNRVEGTGYSQEKRLASAPPSPPKPYTQNPPPPSPKPRVFENSYAEPREEELTREQILREIENPSSIKPRPSQSFSAPTQEPPKEYNADPYREPLG